MGKFTFFDVETPNFNNDRISSVGIVVVEDGVTILEANYLVNPEVRFDAFNIKLTGITPFMVSDAPIFAELWPTLKPHFIDSVIVAHNATFDLGVLTMTLNHYGLEVPPLSYICTVVLAKKYLRYRRNSLDYLCATLGVLLERHHEALSDAKGCQGIFYHIVEHHGYSDQFVKTFYKPEMRGVSKQVKLPRQPNGYKPLELASTTDVVQIRDMVFCLTGDFKFGTKTDVELFILARGGKVVSQVTKQVDYLVVGALGSPLWAYGNYGTKVKRAIELREAGSGLDIVLESDFFGQM